MAMQMVELHFVAEPKCDYAAIQSRAEGLLGEQLDAPRSDSMEKAFLFFHKQHPVQLKDAVIAPQTALLHANQPINMEGYADDIQQSWRFRDCAAVLAKSNHTILVTEMMARTLPPPERVRLFHGVLQAVMNLPSPSPLSSNTRNKSYNLRLIWTVQMIHQFYGRVH